MAECPGFWRTTNNQVAAAEPGQVYKDSCQSSTDLPKHSDNGCEAGAWVTMGGLSVNTRTVLCMSDKSMYISEFIKFLNFYLSY